MKTKPFPQRATRYPAEGSFLIVGHGNPQRGDDAIGAQVADTVASWNLSDVEAITVHQLMPELAIAVAKANYVIFVDACSEESCARSIQLTPISPSSHDLLNTAHPAAARSSGLTHSHSAQGLLALTQKAYGHVPQAWRLQVPTESFNFDQQLSSTAQRGVDEATRTIERFIINYRVPYPVNLDPYRKSA